MACRAPRAPGQGCLRRACGAADSSRSRTAPPRPRSAERCKSSGTPRVHAGSTSTCAGSPGSERGRLFAIGRKTRASRSIVCSSEDSSGRSLRRAVLITAHRHEQVCDAGRTHVAERCKLVVIGTIEQQNAAPKYLPLVNRLERPCRRELLG